MQHSGASTLPPSRAIQVAVLCAAALLREGLEEAIRAAPDLGVWEPGARERPDAILWVAESGAGLQVLCESALPDAGRPAVLLDAAGRLGPMGAGLHGFLGYLPPEVDA